MLYYYNRHRWFHSHNRPATIIQSNDFCRAPSWIPFNLLVFWAKILHLCLCSCQINPLIKFYKHRTCIFLLFSPQLCKFLWLLTRFSDQPMGDTQFILARVSLPAHIVFTPESLKKWPFHLSLLPTLPQMALSEEEKLSLTKNWRLICTNTTRKKGFSLDFFIKWVKRTEVGRI